MTDYPSPEQRLAGSLKATELAARRRARREEMESLGFPLVDQLNDQKERGRRSNVVIRRSVIYKRLVLDGNFYAPLGSRPAHLYRILGGIDGAPHPGPAKRVLTVPGPEFVQTINSLLGTEFKLEEFVGVTHD